MNENAMRIEAQFHCTLTTILSLSFPAFLVLFLHFHRFWP